MSIVQLFILLLAGLYLLITSVLDIKNRFVYDYLTYSFGSIFLILRIILAWQENSFFQFYGIIPYFLGTLIVSFLLYKLGHWGGGDLKLLGALSIAIPFFPDSKGLSFFVNFLSNTLIAALVYGIVYSLIMMVANFNKLKNIYTKFDSVITFLTVIASVVFFVLLNPLGKILSIIILLLPVVYLIRKAEDSVFIIEKKVKNLEPGDWITEDIEISKNKKIVKKPTGISKEDIELLKNSKYKKIKIRDGLPFVPSFFFGFLLTLFYGNLFLSFMKLVFTSI